MRLAALLLLVTACRADGGSDTASVHVATYAGEQPAPGIRVFSHRPDGQVIDDVVTDAVGGADISTDDGSLVTALFPAAARTYVMTTVAPTDGLPLELHGPDTRQPPVLVDGVLHVNAPLVTGATFYEIDLGCVTVSVTEFPRAIDITSCNLGSDTNLDVLVRAFHVVGETRVLDAYASARVPTFDGRAIMDVVEWKTTGTDLPLVISVDSPAINYTFYVDGNAYDGPPVVDGHVFAYTPLDVKSCYYRAVVGTTTYERYGAGLYSFELYPSSFLPAIETTTSRTASGFAWEDPAVDATHVVLTVTAQDLVWEAILSPTTTEIEVPPSVGVREPWAVLLRYMNVNGPLHGLRATTIVQRPTLSLTDVSTTEASGLR